MVTIKYDARARIVVVGIATAAIAAAEERRRIADARAAAAATMEGAKLTDKVNGMINIARSGSPTLGGQSPAAPQWRRHPPLPSSC